MICFRDLDVFLLQMYIANITISNPNGLEMKKVTLQSERKLLYLWEVMKNFNTILEREHPPPMGWYYRKAVYKLDGKIISSNPVGLQG